MMPSVLGTKVAPQPGDFFGRYELLCVISRGGMGTVWLGVPRDGPLEMSSLVALKTILPVHSGNPDFRRMFLDEARISSQINHPNVAGILEIGEERGALYYTMEYIEGEHVGRLHREVRRSGTGFPLAAALRICADASSGLHAAHELCSDDGSLFEVVHRDVSPQNLLITPAGGVKLIDFGIAKARDRLAPETALGTLKGRIEYMSPEQARGGTVDRRADVYSLGSVLYELISGRPVHDTKGGNQISCLQALLSGVPAPPLDTWVPETVQQIVNIALARAPENRFSTALEFRDAIEEAMTAASLGGDPGDVAGLLARHAKRRLSRQRDLVEIAIRAAVERRRQAISPARPTAPAAPGESSLTILAVPIAFQESGDEVAAVPANRAGAGGATGAGFDSVLNRAMKLAAKAVSTREPDPSSPASLPAAAGSATAVAIDFLIHAANEHVQGSPSGRLQESGSHAGASTRTIEVAAPFRGEEAPDVTQKTVVDVGVANARHSPQAAPANTPNPLDTPSTGSKIASERARPRSLTETRVARISDPARSSQPIAPTNRAPRELPTKIAIGVVIFLLVTMMTFRAARRLLGGGAHDASSADVSSASTTPPQESDPGQPTVQSPPQTSPRKAPGAEGTTRPATGPRRPSRAGQSKNASGDGDYGF